MEVDNSYNSENTLSNEPTNNNKEEVLNTTEKVENLTDDFITILKGKFLSTESNIYGIFLFEYYERTNILQRVELQLSNYSIFYQNCNETTSIPDYLKIVVDIRESISSHRALYIRMKSYIQKNLSFNGLKIDKPDGVMDMKLEVDKVIKRALMEKKINIMCFVERMPFHEYCRLIEENNTKPVKKKHKGIFDIDPNYKLINCYPVVAPVEGVPIFSIKENDTIFVKITKKDLPFFQIDHNSEQNDLVVKGTISKVEFHGGSCSILLYFKDNIYGKLIETENIKLKIASRDTSIDTVNPNPNLVNNYSNVSNYNPFVYGLIILLLLLMLTAFYLFFT